MLKQENKKKLKSKAGKEKINMKGVTAKPKSTTPFEVLSLTNQKLNTEKKKSKKLASPGEVPSNIQSRKLQDGLGVRAKKRKQRDSVTVSPDLEDSIHSQQNDATPSGETKKKRKRNAKKNRVSESSDQVESELKSDISSPKTMKSHKRFIMKKLKSERLDKGLIMLDQKSESKIYKLKKALVRKGMPEDDVRKTINKERRTREQNFRKDNTRVCFRCRKPGHLFADCSEVVMDNEQGTGICFRCGSSEHILRQCQVQKKRGGNLPFAKCFVCGVQGHLSNECPKNQYGAYPRGGECNACGSIQHLKKDCPNLNESTESVPTARTIQAGMSADTLDDSENSE